MARKRNQGIRGNHIRNSKVGNDFDNVSGLRILSGPSNQYRYILSYLSFIRKMMVNLTNSIL